MDEANMEADGGLPERQAKKKTISGYYHLVGGPEPARSNRVEKWTRHERYTKYPNSETELVEFLKEVQRK